MARHATAIYEAFYLDGMDPGGLGADLQLPPPEGAPDDTPEGGTGFGTRDPTDIPAGAMTPSGWPAAVQVRPDNWDLSLQPARYEIAAGDTLSGLAQTYAGDPQQWKAIFDLNKPTPIANPDKIFAGQVVAMPDNMRDNFVAWLNLGSPTGAAPGQLSKEDIAKGSGASGFYQRNKTAIIVGGIAAVVAGGAYYLST